jgi:two-component system, sensor histidine kinase ChiS
MASVLVVDDDELLRETIGNVVAIDGHDVATASNGNQAIELLESGITPDVIILDILMPQSFGASGYRG